MVLPNKTTHLHTGNDLTVPSTRETNITSPVLVMAQIRTDVNDDGRGENIQWQHQNKNHNTLL